MIRKLICLVLAAVCLLYYCGMSIFNTGFRISQQYLWLLLAAALVVWGILPILRIPLKLLKLANVLLACAVALFLIVESLVVWGMVQQPKEKPDCLIVLGAGLNGKTPSHSLQLRLEKTLELMEADPELTAVVTGGQGAGEDMTEALCMKEWLVDRGIAEHRIFMEDKSTSTAENLRFGLPMLEKNTVRVGIVTNNFHVFRSLCIAEKISGELGIDCEFQGIAARYPSVFLLHFMVREFCTICNDALRGNLAWPF